MDVLYTNKTIKPDSMFYKPKLPYTNTKKALSSTL